MDSSENRLLLMLRLSRPFLLLAGFIQAVVGAGVARYLNYHIDWTLVWFGILWLLTLQLSAQYLDQYFDLIIEVDPESHTRLFGGNPVLGSGEGKLPPRTALIAGLTSLAAAGGFTIVLLWYAGVGIAAGLVMLLIFASAMAYSLPPVRLSRSGYGELVAAVYFGFLIPALSFVLQAGEIHRLITMIAVPLVLLTISMMLALSFPTYAADQKHNRTNMLQKIGWENSMMIHNSLILLAFLSLGGASLLGFPRSIGMRALWPIPLAFLQVWLMGRIAAGQKPVWQVVRLNAVSMVGVMVFSFLISFWI